MSDLLLKFNILRQAVNQAYRPALLRSGISTVTQFLAMVVVEGHPGATNIKVVKITGIDRNTFSQIAIRLENKGFLERTTCSSDLRAVNLRLTPDGREALKQARKFLAHVDTRLLELNPQLSSILEASE